MWIDSCNDVEGKMKILIFGMGNIGKSTVGEFLARKIGYDFIDMDAKIKEKYGTMLGFQDEYNDQYERDELRAEMISAWIQENENVVIALSPIAYLDAYEDFFEDSDSWGVMKDSVWDNYTNFMYETGLIDHKIDAKDQYTNEFVK